MACDNCNNDQLTSNSSYPSGCDSCTGCVDGNCPEGIRDSSCVVYTGAALTCIGVSSNICLETILQKIDVQICSAVLVDYSTYDLGCLRNNYSISTAQQFAEAISGSFCYLNSAFTDFTTVTYPSDLQGLQNQIDDLNNIGLTSCATVNIIPSDTQNVVLNKLSSSLCAVYGLLNPSTANWNQCFTIVGANPSTIVQGFNAVLGQVCQLKSMIGSGGIAPTFDNTGSCLASPTTTDTLFDTVVKIRTRLCLTPTFVASNLPTSDCVAFASNATLETVLGAINTQVNLVSKTAIRAVNTSHFILTNIDNSNPCLGKTISLNTAYVGSDKLVALTSADTTPGYLSDKIKPGTNITFDTTTNPGAITVNGTASALDGKVKVNVSGTSGYLSDKIIGQAGNPISTTAIVSGDKVVVSASLDGDALLDQLLTLLETDDTFKARLCAIMSSCPSPCAPPTNVSYTIV